MIPDFLFDEIFDNGYGKFSIWDSARAFLGIDQDGFVFRNGEWRFSHTACRITGVWTGKWECKP